jgi:hypothetical protein
VGDAGSFHFPCSAIDLLNLAQQRLYISTASQDTQNQYIFIMTEDVGRPPAHRDKTAMNGAQLSKSHGDSSGLMSGAQLSKAHGDSSGLMSGPPAGYRDPRGP